MKIVTFEELEQLGRELELQKKAAETKARLEAARKQAEFDAMMLTRAQEIISNQLGVVLPGRWSAQIGAECYFEIWSSGAASVELVVDVQVQLCWLLILRNGEIVVQEVTDVTLERIALALMEAKALAAEDAVKPEPVRVPVADAVIPIVTVNIPELVALIRDVVMEMRA